MPPQESEFLSSSDSLELKAGLVHEDIERIATALRLDLGALKKANDLALKGMQDVSNHLHVKFPLPSGKQSDIDVVFLGSYARGEARKGSDRDYLVILNGPVDPHVPPDYIREVETICDELSILKAGAGGLFADVAIGPELYTRIGLADDTNVNISRRLLLLTESVSVYCKQTHEDIIRKIIDRYCIDYDEAASQGDHARVPRFLLNDLVRYWRTIAVDFGAKRWRAAAQDWHVRHAKLLISRKVLFAGALASLFLTPTAISSGANVRDHLFREFRKPSLARLAGIFNYLTPDGKESIKNILCSYNRFLEILDSQDVERGDLAKAKTETAQALLGEMKKLGKIIQEGLETIFYDDPLFSKITRRYGLF
jgi:hypothetical protein